jgi:heme oxygenase
MKIFIIMLFLLSSVSTWAKFDLASNGKKITCYADDNQSIEVNAKRTVLKYTVEGESLGAKQISKTVTDNKNYVSYQTSVGTLVLSNNADTFQLAEDNFSGEVKCK